MIQSAHIRNSVSFFQSVSKVCSQCTTNADCRKIFAQVRKFFYSWVTVKELRLCIKNLVENFCNLRARTFVKVFDVDIAAFLLWRFYDSLQNGVVWNIKSRCPDSWFKSFAVNWNYRNRIFVFEFVGKSVYVFSDYARNTACRNKNCIRVIFFPSVLNDFSKWINCTKHSVVFIQIRADKNWICSFVYAGCNLSEFYSIVWSHSSTACRCVVNYSNISNGSQSI